MQIVECYNCDVSALHGTDRPMKTGSKSCDENGTKSRDENGTDFMKSFPRDSKSV